MNGSALYECAVVLFVAQAYGVELSLYQQFVTVLMVLLAAIGTAGIPMASLVMIIIILKTVGLPPEGIGLVLAVDRPLDMCRSAVNVYSDTCCAIIVAKSEGEALDV
jgi:Na+/H+-dicarboxylate symporter